jgi:hypothetical protein
MAANNGGFLKLMRGPETEELMGHPNEFLLLTIISYRARRSDSFNGEGLQPGEAVIGDFRNYGLTERQYRTAKQRLEKWRFSTFRATNKGTIAKLTDSRVWDINMNEGDGQATGKRQKNDRQTTDTTTGTGTGKEQDKKCFETIFYAALTGDSDRLNDGQDFENRQAKPKKVTTNKKTTKETRIPPHTPHRGADYGEDFLAFWAAYPKKVGKDAAHASWKKRAGDRPSIVEIIAAISKQRVTDQWQKDGGQYVPNPATWINQGRWADEIQPTAASRTADAEGYRV